jgi:hypothetical protein
MIRGISYLTHQVDDIGNRNYCLEAGESYTAELCGRGRRDVECAGGCSHAEWAVSGAVHLNDGFPFPKLLDHQNQASDGEDDWNVEKDLGDSCHKIRPHGQSSGGEHGNDCRYENGVPKDTRFKGKVEIFADIGEHNGVCKAVQDD